MIRGHNFIFKISVFRSGSVIASLRMATHEYIRVPPRFKGPFHDHCMLLLWHSSVDRQHKLIAKYPVNSEVAFVSYPML